MIKRCSYCRQKFDILSSYTLVWKFKEIFRGSVTWICPDCNNKRRPTMRRAASNPQKINPPTKD
jgi:predicted RNA-binding Zn-ribbon protein involved in translation (DUF1610 family)